MRAAVTRGYVMRRIYLYIAGHEPSAAERNKIRDAIIECGLEAWHG